ncbi:MAG: hypothetical protein PF569_05990 [Candidatus Woesearchaeota archaeon]|jgi:phosphate uptake regulator|nr:hypothetical protein [Candidatus Woesearchaeota archaeon]
MERQLVKQGRNALTMTLPSKWIKSHYLSEKDSVQVREEKGELIISSNKSLEKREIKLDIRGMRRGLAFHIITGKYIEGYDRIILKHDNFSLSQEIGNGFLGMIIENHTSEELIMKDIIGIPEDDFIMLFKRGCQLLIQQARTIRKQLEKQATKEDVKNEERLLDNNLFYCLRYINKYEKVENSYKYFLLTSTIESIGDYLSELSKRLDVKKRISKTDIENIDLTIKSIEMYVVYLFENNIHKMYDLLSKFKKNIHRDSFIGGLCFAIEENLYNYIGYFIEK